MQFFSVYQPVISMNRRCIIFCEALGRGRDPNGEIIPPFNLFQAANTNERLTHLDRSLIHAALNGWKDRANQQLLSVNIDVRCLQNDSVDFLCRTLEESQVSPSQVILEICENKTENTDALLHFVNHSRQCGFLIAIDDLGKEYSNLDRIVSLAPDLIKLDRELITNVHQDPAKRALVRSMVRFGEECGAQVVAEGVECWEDVFALMEQGIDLFQGYYFARPRECCQEPSPWLPKLDILNKSFQAHRANEIRHVRIIRDILDGILLRVNQNLSNYHVYELDRILAHYAEAFPQIECIYTIDEWGEQISRTHFSRTKNNTPRTSLFKPACSGHNHSLKSYFQHTPKQGSFLSDLYISQATGTECRTFSQWFHDAEGQRHILCIDFSDQTMLGVTHSRNFKVEYYFEI